MKTLFTSILLLIVLAFVACKSDQNDKNVSGLIVPDDLMVTLWAESPAFYNPTNIDIDAKGRVWVTEAVNYRNYNNDSTRTLHHSLGDRVMILEDTDDDGIADSSKIFVQDKDLVSPMGIAVIGHKVYISCSPNLIVYTDDNGDDIPDHKEIFLTGFGGLDHDHALHAVIGGPDGDLYFNTGNAGPHIVTDHQGWTLRSGSLYTGGSPYNTTNQGKMVSDDGKIWVGGLGLKIKPDGSGLKVIGHNFRNSYELTVDSRGDVWQNDNDDQVVTCRTSWLMEGGNAGFFSTDGTRYWQADQRPGQDIFTAHWHQEDPGIMPAGDRTGAGSPTGVAFYEGDALGKKYRGMLLSADAGRNVIFAYHPERQLSGYDLGARMNLVTSLHDDNEGYVWNDSLANTEHAKWFRPSDIAIGTDGALYIADWYDPVVGGHQMQDTLGYGRIYRVTPKGKKLKRPILDFTNTEGLLKGLRSPAINVRYEATELLKTRGQYILPSALKVLKSSNPYERAQAIWLVASLGDQGINKVEKLLDDNREETRVVAFRALRRYGHEVMSYATKMIEDTSCFMRREVIQSIAELPYDLKQSILLTAAKNFNPSDRWYLEALGQAVIGDEEKFLKDLRSLFDLPGMDPVQWSDTVEALIWRLHPASMVPQLTARAGSPLLTPTQRNRSATALAFIKDTSAVVAMMKLATSDLGDVREQAIYWLAFRQSNDWSSLYDWHKWNRNPAKERKLAELKVRLSKIVDPKLPYNEKKSNAKAMAKDTVGANMILTAISHHEFPADLYKEVSDSLLHHRDVTIRILASQYFSPDSATQAYSIPDITSMQGSALTGKSLFSTKCAICHKLENKGNSIGPDLSMIHQKYDKAALLDAIINPSAGIVFGYEAWTITTKDGQSYMGFIVSENGQSISLKTLGGANQNIALTNITSRSKQSKSIMPTAGQGKLTDKDLADISTYLLGVGK